MAWFWNHDILASLHYRTEWQSIDLHDDPVRSKTLFFIHDLKVTSLMLWSILKSYKERCYETHDRLVSTNTLHGLRKKLIPVLCRPWHFVDWNQKRRLYYRTCACKHTNTLALDLRTVTAARDANAILCTRLLIETERTLECGFGGLWQSSEMRDNIVKPFLRELEGSDLCIQTTTWSERN